MGLCGLVAGALPPSEESQVLSFSEYAAVSRVLHVNHRRGTLCPPSCRHRACPVWLSAVHLLFSIAFERPTEDTFTLHCPNSLALGQPCRKCAPARPVTHVHSTPHCLRLLQSALASAPCVSALLHMRTHTAVRERSLGPERGPDGPHRAGVPRGRPVLGPRVATIQGPSSPVRPAQWPLGRAGHRAPGAGAAGERAIKHSKRCRRVRVTSVVPSWRRGGALLPCWCIEQLTQIM
jgi:hypothetical protein